MLQKGVRSNNLTVLTKKKQGGKKRRGKKKKDTEIGIHIIRLKRHSFEINGN